MTKDEIYKMAQEAGFESNSLGMTYTSGRLPELLERFAKLVADKVYALQLELPEPRLTGKFSITAGKFKCTGCTGTWTNREDAKHHSCRDYQ
jgi:hypothetical protein